MERIPSLGGKLELGKERRPEFGPIWLDLNSRRVALANSSDHEDLSSTEYQILWLLIRASGNMITEEEMLNFIHDDDSKDAPVGNQVNVYISKLREKLNRLTRGTVKIETIRGLAGYRISVETDIPS